MEYFITFQEQRLDLGLEGQPSGQLFVKTAFLPAGKLTFVCEGARGLRETSAAGRMDPYVVFKAEGQVLKEAPSSCIVWALHFYYALLVTLTPVSLVID